MNLKPMVASQQQLEYNQERFKQLLEDARVIKLMKQWNLTPEIVYQNLSKFDYYISYLDSRDKSSFNVLADHQMVLAYRDGVFSIEFVLDEAILKEKTLKAHLNCFLINQMPKANELVCFDEIELDKESPNYISLYNKLVDLQFDSVQGYFIYGDIGCGKTYLLSCLANEFARNQKTVCFVKVNQLMTMMRDSFQKNNGSNEFDALINDMKKCDLLILDDLGAEHVTAYSRDEILFPILDYRMEHKKLVCCSSNYDFEGLLDIYQKASNSIDRINALRLLERLSVLCHFIHMYGSSRRFKA